MPSRRPRGTGARRRRRAASAAASRCAGCAGRPRHGGRAAKAQSNGSFPIIGVGGIHSAEDAFEKLQAGASLVQIYTGFIYEGPAIVRKINKGLVKLIAQS